MAVKMQGSNVWILEGPGDYIDQWMKVKQILWVGSEDPERGEIVDGDMIELYQVDDFEYYDQRGQIVTRKQAKYNVPLWREKATQAVSSLDRVFDTWVKSIWVQTLDHGEVHVIIE